jgi:hypothetical protein
MEHVVCFRETVSACLILVGESERMRQLAKLFVDARIILKWIRKNMVR